MNRISRMVLAVGVACGCIGWTESAIAEDIEQLKVGMVSDGGRFDDGGYNQCCKEGLERAMHEYKVFGYFRKTDNPADYKRKLRELVQKDYELIIGVGYQMKDALGAVAEKNPGTKFAIVDGHYSPPIPNVQGLVFRADEVGFPAGYLAAAWADLMDPEDPRVGFVGGVRIESVEQFTIPFEKGVEYFNKMKNKDVKVKGEYAGTFNDERKGRAIGNALIDSGVDVVFGVGSKTGNGALYAAKEKGKWGIGVDVDQYYSLPDAQSILLTSAIKCMDKAVFEVVSSVFKGTFQGGGPYVGTLENQGVKLAPFHDFDDKIPQEIKADLETIRKGIIDGSIGTGWPPEKKTK